ncbi:diguanylate cyclase [Xanthomonas sp. NCPPB 2865]|nr:MULTISPECIES: GGDEF domain-containing protein [Xanthomonas]MXV48970.1 GGDEF domain-containing protein [Xanthomonas sp. LMG 8993]PPT23393.1 GGDEF domain-containing protein [Xanthomonas arboricola]PPT72309.1 GGDEF domain-containing protein [Xanthomonas arboricola]QWM98424.1 GGDEF domain-containing protein [Xanthomonas sp. MLO165]SOU09535.1 signal transduction protein [Xanthomonas arboricola pv. fragariae]
MSSATPRWRRMAVGMAAMLFSAMLWAQPQPWKSIETAAIDDPRAALQAAQAAFERARSDGDADAQFWALLAQARVLISLEETERRQTVLAQAHAMLERVRGNAAQAQLWLAIVQALSDVRESPNRGMLARLEALRQQARALGRNDLLCEIEAVDMWSMLASGSSDEAWNAAQASYQCAVREHSLSLELDALTQLGSLASRVGGRSAEDNDAEDYLLRALARLRGQPARFQRSLIEYEYGTSLAAQQPDASLLHFRRALALSRELGDQAGVAAALTSASEVLIDAGDAAAALAMAREALPLMQRQGNVGRVAACHAVLLQALTALKSGSLGMEIIAARAADDPNLPLVRRARLLDAIAQALAAEGRHAEAYQELQRANTLRAQSLDRQRDTVMLRLQARYEDARRGAETAELRRRSETAQLALQAREAGQRALWIALCAACLLLLGALVVLAFGARHRRQLSRLAMRDELTGLPNRRAIRAEAQQQVEQAVRSQVPCMLALIDLDHFKLINDMHGHAAGDAVLKALASASRLALRTQDRLGRLGGEEFLLVLPGCSAEEIPAVFARLRNAVAAIEIAGLPANQPVRFCMGAVSVTAGSGLDVLLGQADLALYAAKTAGRDQWAVV